MLPLFRSMKAACPAAILALTIPAGAAHAQEADIEAAAIEQAGKAQAMGAVLFAFDRAAWLATVRMMADLGVDSPAAAVERLGGAAGYIVVPVGQTRLEAIYFTAGDDGPRVAARYAVEGGAIVAGEIVPEAARMPVSPLGRQLIAARSAALDLAGEGGVSVCGSASLNAIPVPLADGGIDVYLLSPATRRGRFPLAGHNRVSVGPDGAVRDARVLTGPCRDAEWDPADDELGMQVVYVERPDAAYPQVIDFFISRHLPFPVGVRTSLGTWPILGGATDRPVPDEDLPQSVPEGQMPVAGR